MKKIFSFILALTAAVAVNATIVDKTIAQLKTANNWANGTKYTSVNLDENISVQILNGGSNSGKYYDNGVQWRLYQAETPNLKISAGEGYTITAISIAYVMEKTGVLVDPTGEWYESATYFVPAEPASNLTFTVANTESSVTNGQARITGFTVAYKAEGEEPEPLDIWVPDTLGVSEILVLINDTDELASKSHFIKGVLYGDPFSPLDNNISFWMYDLENEEDTVEAFNMKKDKWHAFADLDEAQEMIQEGDTVLIYGDAFTNYTDSKGRISPETTSGYLAQVLGKGVRVTMNFDSAYVDYSSRSEEADFLFTGEEDTLRIEALPIPVISKFAGFYRMESGATYGDVELVDISLKVTYVGLTEEGAHIYSVVLKGYAAEDGMLHAFKGDVVFSSNDEDFGGYDDGRLIPRMTVARAIQEGLHGSTEKVYVYGYCSKIRRQYNQPNASGVRYKNAEFYLSDDPECREETGFEAYGCTAIEEIDTLVVIGQLYYVFGELSYFSTANLVEISKGVYNPVDALPENILDVDPELEPDTVSAQRAYEIGMELPEPGLNAEEITEKLYFIIGIVSARSFTDYDTEYKNQTWLMANTAEYDGDMIQIFRAKPDAEDPAKIGDKMGVLSKIRRYHGSKEVNGVTSEYTSISTTQGAMAIHTDLEIPDDIEPEAIPEVLMDASKVRSIKTIEDGQIIVIKNGVKYNLLGTRL